MLNIPDPAAVADWWFVLAGIATIVTVLYKMARKLEKISDMEKKLSKEFGGNSGGIRQAVNTMTKTVEEIKESVEDIRESVTHLRGRFEQHVEDTKG